MYRLTWRLPDQTIKRTLWLDTRRDYWPVRLELRMLKADDSTPPFLESRLELRETSDLWLPQRFTIRQYNQEQILNFTWESVNQPVDDALFSHESFTLKPEHMVVDGRLGQAITIRGRLDMPASDNEEPESNTRIWLIVIGAAVALGLFVWRVRRLRAARPIPKS